MKRLWYQIEQESNGKQAFFNSSNKNQIPYLIRDSYGLLLINSTLLFVLIQNQ